MWKKVLDDPNTEQFETLPMIRADCLIQETDFTTLLAGTYTQEADMYDPILASLGNQLT